MPSQHHPAYGPARRFFTANTAPAKRWQCAALAVALGASITPAAQAGIIAQWQGGNLNQDYALNVGSIPPDMGGAVGNGYVMQSLNDIVNIYTTSGTQVGPTITAEQFWENAGLSSATFGGTPYVSDPRVVYDPASGRWFASEISLQDTSNNILVAVSKTSDPTAGFTGFSITSPGDFADYPTLGVNGAAVTIGINNFDLSNNQVGSSLYSIPKASLLAATPSVAGYAAFHNSSSIAGTPQAVTNAAGTGTSTTVLSNNYNTPGLSISTISGANAAGATLAHTANLSSVSGTAPTAPTQPGGSTYDQGDNRLAAAYQVGNLIYFANNVSNGSSDVIQWGIIDSLTNTLVKSGSVATPGLDLTYPSISANPNGTFVIGFNGSGSTTNISAYYTVCSEQTGTCQSPSLAYAGLASNYFVDYGTGDNRWGDYSATVVDPNNPANFWLFQEIPLDNTTWGTSITEIGTTIPEPPTVALLAIGMIGFRCARRKRRE